MELTPGTKLGPYEIVSPIGAGGMGEVFKARDTRLDRTVAIKVMPKYIAAREDFRVRFEREARTVSNLKHPHICVLHDIGKQDGTDFMVLEFLEGETLAARIAKGPIPLDQVLKFATQIADALDRAHRSGVSHRDVKPANVMITRDGCKVLDFGLAKTAPKVIAPDDPTLTAALTREGTILGTPQYMAPEQYEGREADARSDIFAFGCVVYEMVTGKRCFDGKTRASLIAAVLGADPPPMSSLAPVTPLALERVVKQCIAKDPEDRYQSMRDVVLEMRDIQGGGDDGPKPTSTFSRRAWIAAAAILAVALCVALWSPWRSEKHADRPLVRLDVDLGSDVSLASTVAISPDGTRLAYVSGTPASLFTRRLDQPNATRLPGTEGAAAPFFSPDGQWVGFNSPFRLLSKISVAGGGVVPLAEAGANFAGASWCEDGSIFVSTAFQRGLQRIPAGGGPPQKIAELGEGEVGFTSPQILPGDKAILFSVNKAMGVDTETIEVLTLADGHRKVVARGGDFPRYLPTSSALGHLLYVNKGTLFGVVFDPAKLETRGTAVPILDNVANIQFGFSPAASGNGTLVYRKAGAGDTGLKALQWVDSNGKIEQLRVKPGPYTSPSLSPDGKRVALTVHEGGSPDVWIYDLQRDAMTRITFGGASYRFSAWSVDGQYLVFTSDGRGMFQARADGAGQPQTLTQGKPFQFPWSFSPDGRRLAYFETAGTYQIWTVPVEDTGGLLKAGKPEQFLKTSFNDVFPSFSPDGRWLAYRSDESGKYEVYVQTFPSPLSGKGGKWQVSNNGGSVLRWPRNARELFYQSGDQIMTAAYAVKEDTFVTEKPRVWLNTLGVTIWDWDVAPDGKRLLVVKPVDSPQAPKQEHEVVFLENFYDYLRQRLPLAR